MPISEEQMAQVIDQLDRSVADYNDACRMLHAEGLKVDAQFMSHATIGEQFEREHMSVAVFKRVNL